MASVNSLLTSLQYCSAYLLKARNSQVTLNGCGGDRMYENGFILNSIKSDVTFVNILKYHCFFANLDNEFENKSEDVVKVPLLGKITAGNPITAIETPNEFFDLPASLVPSSSEVFTLHVSGESMINAGIFDNDYVIVRKQNTARNGQIVVAMTIDDSATVKTFYKESDHIRLQPENDTMDPIILPNCVILGIAIGLYRKI